MEGPPWARAAPGPRRLLSSAAKLRKGRRLRTSLRLGSWIHRARLTPPLSSLILYSDLNLNPGFNTGSFRSLGRPLNLPKPSRFPLTQKVRGDKTFQEGSL